MGSRDRKDARTTLRSVGPLTPVWSPSDTAALRERLAGQEVRARGTSGT